MPGINFVCDLKGNLKKRESIILQSLNSVMHNEHCEKKILLCEKFYFLSYIKYREYPITFFENNEFYFCLEGKIYGKNNHTINKELNSLAKCVFQGKTNSKKITKWLLNTDGDFIAFILNKISNEIVIINDALGRLPLYYHINNGQVLVSRGLRFIADLIDEKKIDRMAVAQYLLFGYSLGKRTFLEKVNRLEPATLIKIDINQMETEIVNLHRFNFEIKKNCSKNIETNISELESLFSKACKNRTNSSKKNILSLSGGLDSRTVGACFHKNRISFSGATLLDYDKKAVLDAKLAGITATSFGIEWKLFQLGPPSGKDILRLLKLKNGLDHLGMTYFLQYVEKIKETYGSGINFLTGDGGDKILRDLRPFKKLKNLDDLVSYIIVNNYIFSLEDASKLAEIRKSEIINELKNHLLSYPEKDLNQRYVHFLIHERAFKWLFEGEDRNRCCFWSATPFYSIHFFNYAINCPDEQKSENALQRTFLSTLCASVASINYTDWDLPIISRKNKFVQYLYSTLSKFPCLKRKLRNMIEKRTTGSYKCCSNFIKCIQEQIIKCKPICDNLSYSTLNSILKNCIEHKKTEIEYLFTVTSALEMLLCSESTIEKFYKSEFI